jgi:hypothetical protein
MIDVGQLLVVGERMDRGDLTIFPAKGIVSCLG